MKRKFLLLVIIALLTVTQSAGADPQPHYKEPSGKPVYLLSAVLKPGVKKARLKVSVNPTSRAKCGRELYIRSRDDYRDGTHDLDEVTCGEKPYFFEVWTGVCVSAPQKASSDITVSISGKVESMQPVNLRRTASPHVLRKDHKVDLDFGILIRVKCKDA